MCPRLEWGPATTTRGRGWGRGRVSGSGSGRGSDRCRGRGRGRITVRMRYAEYWLVAQRGWAARDTIMSHFGCWGPYSARCPCPFRPLRARTGWVIIRGRGV